MYIKLNNTLKKWFFLEWSYSIIYYKLLSPGLILLRTIIQKSLESKDLMYFFLSPQKTVSDVINLKILFMDGGQNPMANPEPFEGLDLFGGPNLFNNSELNMPPVP